MSKEHIALKDLKIGMFVQLPVNWTAHDFLRNSFLIRTEKQLQKLQQQNLQQVLVDFDRSQLQNDALPRPTSSEPVPTPEAELMADSSDDAPTNWDSKKLMTDELRNVLDDHRLSPEQKARSVYDHSVRMMEQLLEFPTAENIKISKEVIYEISEIVLTENDTAMNLLRITAHDYYTYTHSVTVGILGIILSKHLLYQSDTHDLHELAAGFFLHDLGKVTIDTKILNKRGRLSEQEMQYVRSHPDQGYQILQRANELSEECKIIVMQHHESIDGSGYPNHLKGDEIHLYGQICGLVDVYAALTSERSYKRALSSYNALKLIKNQMMHRFDKKLFDSFVKIF